MSKYSSDIYYPIYKLEKPDNLPQAQMNKELSTTAAIIIGQTHMNDTSP